jgi:hypothetical protein
MPPGCRRTSGCPPSPRPAAGVPAHCVQQLYGPGSGAARKHDLHHSALQLSAATATHRVVEWPAHRTHVISVARSSLYSTSSPRLSATATTRPFRRLPVTPATLPAPGHPARRRHRLYRAQRGPARGQPGHSPHRTRRRRGPHRPRAAFPLAGHRPPAGRPGSASGIPAPQGPARRVRAKSGFAAVRTSQNRSQPDMQIDRTRNRKHPIHVRI